MWEFDIKDEDYTEDQLNAIAELRKLLATNNCKLPVCTKNHLLSKYLFNSDWDPRQALGRMQQVYKLKHDYPKWFAQRKVSEYMDMWNNKVKVILDKRDRHGRRIYVFKVGNMLPTLDFYDAAQTDDILFMAALAELETQKKGLSVILDLKGLSIKHFKWLTPNKMRIAVKKAEILPTKNVHFHVVNTSNLFSKVLNLILPLVSEKLKAQLHLHYGDRASLHSSLGRDCLPEEYGGPAGSVIEYDRLYKQLFDVEDYLDDLRLTQIL